MWKLGLAVVLALVTVGPASAQKISKSTLSGVVASASALVPCDTAGATIYTVPAGKSFVLTQICFDGCGECKSTSLARIFDETSDADPCARYVVGLALPAGDTITCTNTSACGGCIPRAATVTGVLTK